MRLASSYGFPAGAPTPIRGREHAREREAREEVFKLRLKLRTNQLESRTNYYNARRELARILTLLQEQAKSAATAASANAAARKG